MIVVPRLLIGILLFIVMVPARSGAPTPAKNVYDYSLVGADASVVPLSTYKGKVLLIVNLASKSVYTSQISALDDLQKAYADKGLVVLGIPSGDFGAEELADNAAILNYYRNSEHVTFQVFSKASLRGKDTIPLIHFLTDPKEGAGGGEIHWNFTKFLVDRQGKPVLRFEADSDPSDPSFRVKIEEVLNGTYQKKSSDAKEASAPSGDDDDDGGI